jgi:hypothetical protein
MAQDTRQRLSRLNYRSHPRGLGAILVDLVRVAGRVVLVRSGVEEAGPKCAKVVPKVGGGGGVGLQCAGPLSKCC